MHDLASPDPEKLKDTVFAAMVEKAELPMRAKFWLGVLAGVYIGLGGLFAVLVLAEAETLPFGTAQALAGLVFSLGLALVVIAGAELFTGNSLMIGPLMARTIPLPQVMGALSVVYAANLLGALALVALAQGADIASAAGGAVGSAAVELAETKVSKGITTSFFSGILANMLVCLGVWMAYAGGSLASKLMGLILPISAFVALGLEHSIANMFLLPYGMSLQTEPAAVTLTLAAVLGNLVPASLGNLIGGAAIAVIYGHVYAKSNDR